MTIFNKRWVASLAGLVFVFQSAIVCAALVTDYELEFSDVDTVVVGQTFDVDVFLDIPADSELITFGFDFTNSFEHLSFDGFSVASWITADFLNDVGGLADIFGPSGDNIQIATLHFTALSEGTENVSAFGAFFENGGGAFFYDVMSGEFIDGSLGGAFSVNVPEPSALVLMLLGVLGVSRMRSSQK